MTKRELFRNVRNAVDRAFVNAASACGNVNILIEHLRARDAVYHAYEVGAINRRNMNYLLSAIDALH